MYFCESVAFSNKFKLNVKCTYKTFIYLFSGERTWQQSEPTKVKASQLINMCSVCSYSTPFLSNFKRHMLAHSGERSFTCGICGRKFGRKDNLKTHLKIHTINKSFLCHNCNQSFSKFRYFKSHICLT